MTDEDNGWSEWRRHVLNELGRLEDHHRFMNQQLQKILIEVAMLKVKSGVWGLMGGLIPVVVAAMVAYLAK